MYAGDFTPNGTTFSNNFARPIQLSGTLPFGASAWSTFVQNPVNSNQEQGEHVEMDEQENEGLNEEASLIFFGDL